MHRLLPDVVGLAFVLFVILSANGSVVGVFAEDSAGDDFVLDGAADDDLLLEDFAVVGVVGFVVVGFVVVLVGCVVEVVAVDFVLAVVVAVVEETVVVVRACISKKRTKTGGSMIFINLDLEYS